MESASEGDRSEDHGCESDSALSDPDALDLTIRAMNGELLAELTVNGRCSAGQLAEELWRLVPPLPRSEYRLAVGTVALGLSDRLCEHMDSRAELTACVVPSRAGEFFCQVSPLKAVTLGLGLDRAAFCRSERKVGPMSFATSADGYWEDLEGNTLRVILTQEVGSIGSVISITHRLALESLENGDLRVVKGDVGE
ncbi:unnamed protein product, partial [Polarella glacialis]